MPVEQHQIEVPFRKHGQGVLAVFRFHDRNAHRLQKEFGDLPVEWMVIDQQDRQPVRPA